MTPIIPQAAPHLRIARFRDAVDAAVREALSSPAYILGRAVERFERMFAEYVGAAHCVGVNSGTDALTIACRALGLPVGGEVVTVAMTAPATATAIVLAGGVPRFADVSRETRCIDVDSLAAAIGPRTVAVVPVHLHGVPCDMDRITALAAARGLAVVEDCAQAHGATVGGRKVGTFGHAAAFSFYPTKNLGSAGDAGAIVTDDAGVAERARALRAYGWRQGSRSSESIGYNSRLQEIQAAILCVLLPELDAGNRERRAVAERYRRALAPLVAAGSLALPPDADGSVHHQFALALPARDAVRTRLRDRGVGTEVHYATPLHRQPAFARFAPTAEALPATEALAASLLSLPIQPEVALGRAEEIAARTIAAVTGRTGP